MSGTTRPVVGAIRETFGTLGVIASLVFVALEVRQNNVALRAAAIQETVDVARQQTQMLRTNPDLLRIVQMLDHGEQVTEVEAEQQRYVRISFLWGMQGVYRQWRLHVLPPEEWQAWRRVIARTSRVRVSWRSGEEGSERPVSPAFIAEVESCPGFQQG